MTITLTPIEWIFIISILIHLYGIIRMDRARVKFSSLADIHAQEASRHQHAREDLQSNYDKAVNNANLSVQGFNRIANAMNQFVEKGESGWKTVAQSTKEQIKEDAKVTVLPARAPGPNDDDPPSAG